MNPIAYMPGRQVHPSCHDLVAFARPAAEGTGYVDEKRGGRRVLSGPEDHFVRTTELIERMLLASHIAAFPLECCRLDDPVESLQKWFAADGKDFSHVPVRGEDDRIRGVLDRSKCRGRAGLAHSLMDRGLDGIVIDSGASLGEAVQRLEAKGFLLVSSPESGWSDGISGIINHADLQKAPVRVLLFARLAEIEARLRRIIERSGVGWEERADLAEPRRVAADNRKKYHGALPLVYYLNLAHLGAVARACGEIDLSFCSSADLAKLTKIRNQIAHGNEIEAANQPLLTIGRIRQALQLVKRVATGLAKPGSRSRALARR